MDRAQPAIPAKSGEISKAVIKSVDEYLEKIKRNLGRDETLLERIGNLLQQPIVNDQFPKIFGVPAPSEPKSRAKYTDYFYGELQEIYERELRKIGP